MNRLVILAKTAAFAALLIFYACNQDDKKLTCSPYKPPAAIDRYDFPLRPGDAGWAGLKTGQDMVDTLQMPNSVLKTISTAGLMETCLDYPLLLDMIAFPSLQKGTQVQLGNFNGFGELARRPESAALLLQRYQQMGPACFPANATEQQRGAYTFTFTYIEMVMAQDEYISKLSDEQRKALMSEALNKYAQEKQLFPDFYSVFNFKTLAFLMARIMIHDRYQPFLEAIAADTHLQAFVNDAEIRGRVEILEKAIKYANQFK